MIHLALLIVSAYIIFHAAIFALQVLYAIGVGAFHFCNHIFADFEEKFFAWLWQFIQALFIVLTIVAILAALYYTHCI